MTISETLFNVGYPRVLISVSPDYERDLKQLLKDAGLYGGQLHAMSAEVTLATVMASAGAGALGLKALVPVLQTFLDRHKNIRVELHEDGTVKAISGTSLEKAQRLIDSVRREQAALHRHDEPSTSLEEQGGATDPGTYRPSGPPTGA